jgi:LysM repeat protein
VIEPDPAEESPPAESPAAPPAERATRWRVLPWVAAVLTLVVLAGIAGWATAYLVSSFSAAPSPDAAFLPTPTPAPSPTPGPVGSPTEAPPTPDTAQTPDTARTPGPIARTPEPTAQPEPGPTPLEYVVQRGDSVGRIALRFGVTPEAIVALNELRNPNRILPGQVLLIPAVSASPAP